jgi:REP element-mobilizing transposase RayT
VGVLAHNQEMTFKTQDVETHLYFVTARIDGGKNLFGSEGYAHIPLECLAWQRKNRRIRLFAFVIMPNHVHYVMMPGEDYVASQVCRQFKSYTAHKILRRVRAEAKAEILAFFESRARGLRDREHKIWSDLQAKNIYSREFLLQKVEYVHNNPINKGWELAQNRVDYPYSSACFYDRDVRPIIEVDDLRKIL